MVRVREVTPEIAVERDGIDIAIVHDGRPVLRVVEGEAALLGLELVRQGEQLSRDRARHARGAERLCVSGPRRVDGRAGLRSIVRSWAPWARRAA